MSGDSYPQQEGAVSAMESVSTQTAGCAHFWRIESPRGPLSRGVCKLCGEEREFRNSLPLSRWDGEAERPNVRLIPGLPTPP